MFDPLLVFRVKRAWAKLSPEQRERLRPHIEEAHQDLSTILHTGKSGPVKSKRELLYVQSSLEDDALLFLKAVEVALEHAAGLRVQPPLDENGDILGFGKFQILDFGWLEAAAVWLEEFNREPPAFRPCVHVALQDTKFTMAIVGDWGTGPWGHGTAPSIKICEQLTKLNPEVSVHLGDVYYAGTHGPEKHNLKKLWPQAKWFSGTLNSNHEMYPKAHPYFHEALADDGPFVKQGGSSVFLLENDFWVIVGLDTAFYSSADTLYMDGCIDATQQAVLKQAGRSGKRVLVLSHHNGLCEDGSQFGAPGALFAQVKDALDGANEVWWYWGHVHCGAAYATVNGDSTLADSGYHCRCIGHGSLPWGYASALADNGKVEWFESKPAGDEHDPERVCNGYAVLEFDGEGLKETIHDEFGNPSWSRSTNAVQRS